MNCLLASSNAKIFSKAMQSLARFGSVLFIDIEKKCLILRSFNSTKSAEGIFRFYKDFFQKYEIEKCGNCKMTLKTCLMVFRNMKQVEYCEICLNTREAKLQVRLKCRLETMKNSLLHIVNEDNIRTAGFHTNESCNIIIGFHKIFTDIFDNFNATDEEITLEAESDYMTFKNYIDGTVVNEQFVCSKLKLPATEFDTYNVDQKARITFCVKEFKALLTFAEAVNENIILNFTQNGNPIYTQVKKTDLFDCVFVISTVSHDDVTFYEKFHNSQRIIDTPTRKKDDCAIISSTLQTEQNGDTVDSTLSNDSVLFHFNSDNFVQPIHGDYIENIPDCNMTTVPFIARSTVLSICPTDKYVKAEATLIQDIFLRCFDAPYVPDEPLPNSEFYVPDSDTED